MQNSKGHVSWLNEQLYTTSGPHAFDLFQKNSSLFQEYHEGFTKQVAKWPENPVSVIISQLRRLPLTTVIADFGCGDAKIAHALKKHTVHSFDLVSTDPLVTACDITTQVPLPNHSVDIGVFCLSLMGTNFADSLHEAHRVLKPQGTLLVAEVKSRFEDLASFLKGLPQLGFSVSNVDDNNKMFVLFTLSRVSKAKKKTDACKLVLKPCKYKKR